MRRDFVANNYWPSKGVEGSKLNDMYQKIKISEDKAKAANGEQARPKSESKAEGKAEREPRDKPKASEEGQEKVKAEATSAATNGEGQKAAN